MIQMQQEREVIFRKTLDSGEQIELTCTPGFEPSWAASLYVDGRHVFRRCRPKAFASPRGENTHYLGYLGGTEPIVELTAAEAASIEEALDARAPNWRATPEGKEFQMDSRRELLAYEYTISLSAAAEAKKSGDMEKYAALSTKMEDAWEALEALDREHPELTPWYYYSSGMIKE